MNNENNKVLIVDDSHFMGQFLRSMLTAEGFTVDTAGDGQEAIYKIKAFRPNVITMDVQMPVMSGLDALKVIMDEYPTPVIMVSALTKRGAEISIKALELGAFDFVAKPGGESYEDIENFKRELISKIKIARLIPASKLRRPQNSLPRSTLAVAKENPATPFGVLAIGTSTGGPSALQTILTQLPANFPLPILVVQHMPKDFTKLMAERLDNVCQLKVKEAEDWDRVEPGTVLVAPGGMQMGLGIKGEEVVVRILAEAPTHTPYKPSVNVLFKAVAEMYGGQAIAMILTGMGSDGLEGARMLKERGALILAESEKTCIVYGMPKCVVEAGLADKVLPLSEISKFICQKVYGSERSVGDGT